MQRPLTFVLLAVLAVPFAGPARLAGQSPGAWPETLDVSAMTFNIRYGSANDGPNHWVNRRDRVFEVLASSHADFLGLQEVLPFQLEEIASALPRYEFLSRTREVDPERGEACPIFYRSDTWSIDRRHQGTFWLSETPEVAGSRSWDSSLPRIATWARFVHSSTGVAVWVFNSHFDHRGEEARRQSASLLRQRIEAVTGDEPVLLLGDFNSGEESEPMRILSAVAGGAGLIDSYRTIERDGNAYTFNGWGERDSGEKIDAIFVRRRSEVVEAAILRPRFDHRAPSDHDPVTATIRVALDRVAVVIAELEGCSSCAGGIARALAKDSRILRAELRADAPVIDLLVRASGKIRDDEIVEIVRQAGYTVESVRHH